MCTVGQMMVAPWINAMCDTKRRRSWSHANSKVAFSCFLPGRVVGGSLAARFGAAAHRRRRWLREVPIRMIPAATNAPPTMTPIESGSMWPRDTSRA